MILLVGRDTDDPLFLQAEEAGPSVLEKHLSPARQAHSGRRSPSSTPWPGALTTTPTRTSGTTGCSPRRSPTAGWSPRPGTERPSARGPHSPGTRTGPPSGRSLGP
jgi:hypothetical protein